MKLLLDTHVWIWSLLEPARLTRKVINLLRDKKSELWLSPISLWEFLIMVEKGKITLLEDTEKWVETALESAPISEAPLTYTIVRAGQKLYMPHRDPADRFIAATAQVLDLTLLTADQTLLQLENVRTRSAR